MIGVDTGTDPPTTALVHRAPWNPKELHLGPADDCHACGTTTNDDDPAFGCSVGLVVSLIIWAIAALAISWWWWSL